MTKTQLLNQFGGESQELRLLLARILDKQALSQARNVPAYSGFLSPGEQGQAQTMLAYMKQGTHVFFGGFPDAERRICAFLPDWMAEDDLPEAGPLRALAATVPPMAKLTHRDYLGALMGLGLTREKIGDILPTDAGCQLIVMEDALPILLDQWATAGRYPVQLAELPLAQLVAGEAETKTIRSTVASLRLDAVVATGFSLSRGKALTLISAGRVSLNHLPCDKADRALAVGDVLSCRGLGKCVLTEVGGQSRKGRTAIVLERY